MLLFWRNSPSNGSFRLMSPSTATSPPSQTLPNVLTVHVCTITEAMWRTTPCDLFHRWQQVVRATLSSRTCPRGAGRPRGWPANSCPFPVGTRGLDDDGRRFSGWAPPRLCTRTSSEVGSRQTATTHRQQPAGSSLHVARLSDVPMFCFVFE